MLNSITNLTLLPSLSRALRAGEALTDIVIRKYAVNVLLKQCPFLVGLDTHQPSLLQACILATNSPHFTIHSVPPSRKLLQVHRVIPSGLPVQVDRHLWLSSRLLLVRTIRVPPAIFYGFLVADPASSLNFSQPSQATMHPPAFGERHTIESPFLLAHIRIYLDPNTVQENFSCGPNRGLSLPRIPRQSQPTS